MGSRSSRYGVKGGHMSTHVDLCRAIYPNVDQEFFLGRGYFCSLAFIVFRFLVYLLSLLFELAFLGRQVS